MSAAMRMSNAQGEDPFAKVKGLIQGLLEKLEAEAAEDASHKAFCDKEMSETETKKNEKQAVLEKLTTKINQMSTRSAKLKEEVAALQTALSELAKADAEMKQLRDKEHTTFVSTKAEMENGLEGVKIALKILREYYAKKDKAHDSADGAAGGIVSMIEVVESDFSKGLTEMNAAEETAQNTYEQETKENEIEKTTKEQDVKYKTKESTGLDKSNAELTSDKENVETELAAVNEYLKKVEDECIAKPETYEDRKARREAEIAGLKDALTVLESETAFIQKGSRTLRGTKRH
jgi:chromosome segregation ATPase